jgi:hypothetical protein
MPRRFGRGGGFDEESWESELEDCALGRGGGRGGGGTPGRGVFIELISVVIELRLDGLEQVSRSPEEESFL